ncbi:MAG: hypothetical protein IJV49_01955, partial [Aeriscardovia sp.]|nr:hypothetical protein [Aeriscardovia sp.]
AAPPVPVLPELVENDFHAVPGFEDGEPFFRIRPCRRRQRGAQTLARRVKPSPLFIVHGPTLTNRGSSTISRSEKM